MLRACSRLDIVALVMLYGCSVCTHGLTAGLAFLACLVLYNVAGCTAHCHVHFDLSLILGFDLKTSPHQGRSVQKVLCLSMQCNTLKHLCLHVAHALLTGCCTPQHSRHDKQDCMCRGRCV